MKPWWFRLLLVPLVFPMVWLLSVEGRAQTEGYDCVSEGAEDLLCLALPSGLTEVEIQTIRNAREKGSVRPGVKYRQVRSMLTEADLTAATTLDMEFEREAILDSATIAEQKARTKPLAAIQALRANQQVQNLYILLNLNGRTGGTGQTSVTSAGQK